MNPTFTYIKSNMDWLSWVVGVILEVPSCCGVEYKRHYIDSSAVH